MNTFTYNDLLLSDLFINTITIPKIWDTHTQTGIHMTLTELTNRVPDCMKAWVDLANNQEEMPPEFSNVLDEHFWELVDDS